MMKAERQEQILKKIEANGRVVVTDYAKELGVTEATLRKDLQELDDRGLVQRVHGGAMKPDTELSRFENRVDLGKDVKMRLAAAAMDEITENRVIFIDGGSTNYLTALAMLQGLHCDLVLLGVSSIDPEYGITTPYLESAETKRALIKAGTKVMSLITPEKFGHVSTYKIADCNALDVIVTEGTPECADALVAAGIALHSIN